MGGIWGVVWCTVCVCACVFGSVLMFVFVRSCSKLDGAGWA